jgi:hypothetical protein
MITLEEQQAVLKPIFEAVSNVKTVFDDFPDAVQNAQLPALLMSAGEAEYDQVTRGAQSLRIRRMWKGILLAEQADLGRQYQAEQTTKPFLTSVPVKLAAYPVVKLADGRSFDLRLDRGRDQGVMPIKYNEVLYTGTLFFFYTIVESLIAPD